MVFFVNILFKKFNLQIFNLTNTSKILTCQLSWTMVLSFTNLEIVGLPTIDAMSSANNMVFIYNSGTAGMVVGTNNKIMVL